MTDQDPLAGAGVGETARVTTDMEHWAHEYHLGEMDGSDRTITDVDVDAETYTDERGDHMVRFTFDGEVMKTLPRRWDYCREPRTADEERTERWRGWLGRVARWGSLAVAVGIPTLLAPWITLQVTDGVTINGEPMAGPGYWELVAVLLVMIAVLAGIQKLIFDYVPDMGVPR